MRTIVMCEPYTCYMLAFKGVVKYHKFNDESSAGEKFHIFHGQTGKCFLLILRVILILHNKVVFVLVSSKTMKVFLAL